MGEGEYTVRITAVTVASISTPAVRADPRRVALVASIGSAGGACQIWGDGGGGTHAEFSLAVALPQEFTYHDHGPLPAGNWGVTTVPGGTTIYFTEVIYLGTQNLPMRGAS